MKKFLVVCFFVAGQALAMRDPLVKREQLIEYKPNGLGEMYLIYDRSNVVRFAAYKTKIEKYFVIYTRDKDARARPTVDDPSYPALARSYFEKVEAAYNKQQNNETKRSIAN